jgi:hypothetical protein
MNAAEKNTCLVIPMQGENVTEMEEAAFDCGYPSRCSKTCMG